MQKISSILDYPQPGLDPDIWDTSGKIKPEHKELIHKILVKHLETEGLSHYQSWIKRIKLIGSLTTYQYATDADVDMHIEVDLPKFIELEKPELDEQAAHDYLNEFRGRINKQSFLLPGTNHLVEYYFETPFVNPKGSPRTGIYDLMTNEWLVPPVSIDKDFDIEELKPFMLDVANQLAQELDIDFGTVKRTVDRLEDLHDVLNRWAPEEQALFRDKLTDKLQKLEEEIKNLSQIREQVVLDRRDDYYDNPEGQSEITFKYLQRFGYLWVMTQLGELLKDDQKITIDEVPKVKEIIEEAQQKEPEDEYPGAGKLMIDFDNTIANNHEVEWPGIGTPFDGVKKALEQFKKDGWEITIYSCRANEPEGVEKIKSFLEEHDLPYDEIFVGKPHAEWYIDDKNILFTNWEEVLKNVQRHESSDKMSCGEMQWKGETETWICPKCKKEKQLKKAQKGNGYDYSSTHVVLPQDIKKKVYQWGEEHIPDDKLFIDEEDNIPGREDNSHVTVLYGLHTNNVDDVSNLLTKEKSIKFALGKIGYFEPKGKEYDVVYVDVESKDLNRLNKLLSDNLEYTTEHPDYNPHMTIAYVKKGEATKYEGQKLFDTVEEFSIDTIVFSPTEGDDQSIKLTADFMPSISISPPSKSWGPDDVEIPVDPDSVSDEETYYAPHVDKPRKGFWKKLIDFFKIKPKKEAAPPDPSEYKKHHIKPMGVTEMMTFRDIAPQEDQDEVDRLIEEDKEQEAWVLMEKYLGRRHLRFSKKDDKFYRPKTTWDDPRQDGEPFSPLPTTFQKDINEKNLNWRHPWKFMKRPSGPGYSDQGDVLDALVNQNKDSENKNASTYTDKEMEEFYVDQHEMHDNPNEGGGYTPRDWNHSTTDYPKPEDLEKYKVRLDILDKPINRRYPPGIPSYEVTWYFGQPSGEYHGDA